MVLTSVECYQALKQNESGIDINKTEIVRLIESIEKAFNNKQIYQTELDENVILYRGNSKDDFELSDILYVNKFISTSIIKEVALNHTKNQCCLYEIKLDKDIKYIDMKKYSILKHEEEILIQSNVYLHKINERMDKSGLKIISVFISNNQILETDEEDIEEYKEKHLKSINVEELQPIFNQALEDYIEEMLELEDIEINMDEIDEKSLNVIKDYSIQLKDLELPILKELLNNYIKENN